MGVDHPAAVPAPWTTPIDTTLSAGPTATRRTMYASDTNGTVYALNPATGHPAGAPPPRSRHGTGDGQRTGLRSRP
ncbi:PQQ-binding-like beta-propeller repeat protein [Streptomyces sp. SAI-208]|uniref:PQQ-binding-like beta-propeller repeat protein n=1 Tax=Streptomyces sp. SAI-208 TaxID=2940550 RepID=UPI002474AC8A|nr:PQQ-binding-like beta-propeller repeat protein [Streptomyces sp. SAI-208]